MKKDIAKHVANFPFMRIQNGSCKIHADSNKGKKKGMVLISSVLYLQMKSNIIFNYWNMEENDLDLSNAPEPAYMIELREEDIVTFPALHIHSVSVKDEDKEEKRMMVVISYYVSTKNLKIWEGSEIIWKRRLSVPVKKPESQLTSFIPPTI